MNTHVNGGSYDNDSVVAFTPNTKPAPRDQLDQAGQTILQLLHRAAGVAEDNSRQALEVAQKVSEQLRAAEDRVAELEAEIESHRDRAERAEQWLHRIYSEIEDRFLRQDDGRRSMQRIAGARHKVIGGLGHAETEKTCRGIGGND